jgi:predicted nucleic acid-binding protein
MYLVDTNVVSELRRPERANRNVARWAAATPLVHQHISVISVLELELGALLIGRRDTTQGGVLRQWIDRQVLPSFEGRILAIDTAIALRCARLHAPDPRSERDALIAATALTHGLTIVTRNQADFAPTGAVVFNPWTFER